LSRLLTFVALAVALCFCGSCVNAAEITAERSENGVVVKIDGKLFTEYLVKSKKKPILWPIIGPTGKEMTRNYPMRDKAGEKKDHPHQRSMWFTHGSVGGADFWSEGNKAGTINHLEFVKVASGDPAVIVTRNEWLALDGHRICEDERTLHFGADADARWIDFDIVLKATDGDVVFGDTKEGMFGVRLAHSMNAELKKGGKIVNSNGKVGDAVWGQPAAWVDCSGPVDDQTVGIAILNHPSSFLYPTCWHVRPYGLFAANPFGLHDFATGGGKISETPETKKIDGSYTLRKGQTITFRYRVVFHCGDERQGKIAERFSAYSDSEKAK
jgi:hypothetical protein